MRAKSAFGLRVMILQLDVGNTRLHWRIIEPAGPRALVLARGDSMTRTAVPEAVQQWPVARVELACVAGETVCKPLFHALAERLGVRIDVADSQARQCGVINSYTDVRTMGVDRWLAMIAAHNHHKGGAIVVDAGTAVTVDYIGANGNHLGGYILPGSDLMRQSLGSKTARVQSGGGSAQGSAPGRSTQQCVDQGMEWLWSSVGERLQRDKETYGLRNLVCTGGDGARLADCMGSTVIREPDLVFLGMELVFAGGDSPGLSRC